MQAMDVSWPTWTAAGLLLATAGLSLLAAWDLNRFLQRTPAIDAPQDLHDFRRLVARQMYGALTMIVPAVAAGLVMGYGVVQDLVTWQEITAVGLFAVVFLLLGVWLKKLEARVKAVPAADPELRAERDRVAQVWVKKMFPDW
jgi:hypothetical protein